MTKKLNELRDYPKWIDSLNEKQRYEWYIVAKEIVERLKSINDDTTELEKAIKVYEIKHSIRS